MGHLNIAGEVKSRFGYGYVVFIPANIPAHKKMEVDIGAEHRLNMLRLAVAGRPDFIVDDCELRRGGTSYTIDTVRELSEIYPIEGKPGLIIGDDLVEDFKTWRDVGKLVELVELIVAHRKSQKDVAIDYPCSYVDNSLFPISSSQIREALRRERTKRAEHAEQVRDAEHPVQAGDAYTGGVSVRSWLPPQVFNYIKCHDLYR
jgi:nicotinate-nucleotide adenylyltransferase